MTIEIDISPKRLRELSVLLLDERNCHFGLVEEVAQLCLALASEKEAAAKQEPAGYTWTDSTGKFRHFAKAPREIGAYNIEPLYLAPRPAPRPTAAEVPLPEPLAHLYPRLSHETHWEECFTPSVQGVHRDHQPVFTADQLRTYAQAYVEAVVAGMKGTK